MITIQYEAAVHHVEFINLKSQLQYYNVCGIVRMSEYPIYKRGTYDDSSIFDHCEYKWQYLE